MEHWSYACTGERGVYLSRKEVEDVGMIRWSGLVTNQNLTKGLKEHDIHRLRPEAWLNDEIISAYGALCYDALPTKEQLSVRVFSTMVGQYITQGHQKQMSPTVIISKQVSAM